MNPAVNVHTGVRTPDQTRDLPTKQNKSAFKESPKKKSKKKNDPNKPKMNGFIKFILVVFVLLVMLIISAVGFTYFTAKAVITAVEETANEEVLQKISSTDGQTTIQLPLQKEYGMVIKGYSKCFNSAGMSNEPTTSSFCSNGNCEITVTFDDLIFPETVELFVEQGNECVAKEFKAGKDVEIVNYFAKVEMTEELKELLAIESDKYRVGSLNSKGRSSFQMMGTKKVILNYNKSVPLSDVLTIDDQHKASIVFN